MSEKHKYKITYAVDNNQEIVGEDVRKKGLGACDQIIIHSIILPPDGSRSELIVSSDGTGKELSSNDYFKSLFGLAHMLSQREDLDPIKKDICLNVVTEVRLMLQMKGAKLGK